MIFNTIALVATTQQLACHLIQMPNFICQSSSLYNTGRQTPNEICSSICARIMSISMVFLIMKQLSQAPKRSLYHKLAVPLAGVALALFSEKDLLAQYKKHVLSEVIAIDLL